ncbi:MAG: AHH domain-containing protein [Gemmataceae bacterium]|nr:AHH domain-containing protein [Gemmataceae bacterium]MCI0738267.1 AHH domain-containing protein [Gemmataceae bacterium]
MAKDPSAERHSFDVLLVGGHIKIKNNTEGGACLNRHEGRKPNSCSHIWQGVKKAQDDCGLYNWPAYAFLALQKTFKTGERKRGRRTAKAPGPYEWDLGRDGNFDHFKKPYWHNHHHVLPNGILNGCLENAKADVSVLMRRELLKVKYNLNHKHNLILLPMGEAVASTLGLPRHLRGYESRAGEPVQTRAHPDYSDQIKQKVESVINDFKQAIDKPTEDHEALKGSLAKKKLERISTVTYEKIIAYGKKSKGAPLDMMKAEDF